MCPPPPPEKWSFRSAFRRGKLDNGSKVIEKGKCRIKLNKPTHTGASILESNQVLMHDFHFNYIKNKYGIKATLLFTNADS